MPSSRASSRTCRSRTALTSRSAAARGVDAGDRAPHAGPQRRRGLPRRRGAAPPPPPPRASRRWRPGRRARPSPARAPGEMSPALSAARVAGRPSTRVTASTSRREAARPETPSVAAASSTAHSLTSVSAAGRAATDAADAAPRSPGARSNIAAGRLRANAASARARGAAARAASRSAAAAASRWAAPEVSSRARESRKRWCSSATKSAGSGTPHRTGLEAGDDVGVVLRRQSTPPRPRTCVRSYGGTRPLTSGNSSRWTSDGRYVRRYLR